MLTMNHTTFLGGCQIISPDQVDPHQNHGDRMKEDREQYFEQ